MQAKFRLTGRGVAQALLVLAPAMGWAAKPADIFPPPGLYRVNADSTTAATVGGKSTSARTTHDSAKGTTTLQGKRADGSTLSPQVMAGAPNTTCIAPLQADRRMAPVAGCSGSPGVVGQDSMTFNLSCGSLKMTTVVRKLNDTTWEYRTRTTDNGSLRGVPGQQDVGGMRAMLEAMAKTGSPEEKAEAAKLLSELGPYEADLKKNAAQHAADRGDAQRVLDQARREGDLSATAARTTDTVQRLTRIGDSCAPKPAR